MITRVISSPFRFASSSRSAGWLLLGLLSVPALRAQFTYATPHIATTLAGKPSQSGTSDGFALDARFKQPDAVALDAAGNLYVSDTNNHAIRKITAAGVVTTFAGLPGSSGSADGTGTAARFHYPEGLGLDAAGNVYVADQGNYTVRKISPAGVVTTLAGQVGTNGIADGTGAAAQFNVSYGLAVSPGGTVYVADTDSCTIRKISPAGVVTTLAGLPYFNGTTDGRGSDARFEAPVGLALDPSGALFVADDLGATIRKITPDGTVSTLAGLGDTTGATDGTGSAARFQYPYGIASDGAGNLYVGCVSGMIRKIAPGGVVTTVAGVSATGAADGLGSDARFNQMGMIAADRNGNVFVADYSNNTIRKVSAPRSTFTTLAGAVGTTGSVDGTGGAARFNNPNGIAVDAVGNTYVADTANHLVRKISFDGVVTKYAGVAGSAGSNDGPATSARFNSPGDVTVDAAGNVFVADSGNNSIRKIATNGTVSTFVPSGTLNNPGAVTCGPDGSLYVADAGNFVVRKITQAGSVSLLAGAVGSPGYTDATGGAARFNVMAELSVDGGGNVYVADPANHAIRKISPAGVVTTLAGSIAGSADGTGTAAQFYFPNGVAAGSAGIVYVTDSTGGTIREITSTGVTVTIAGTPLAGGSADGTGSAARFNQPYGIAVDAAGCLYLADQANQTIRKGDVVPPGNDVFASASTINLTGAAVSVLGTNFGATKELGEPVVASNAAGRSVWWQWTPAAAGIYTLTTKGSSFDTLLGIYVSGSSGLLTAQATNDNGGGSDGSSKIVFSAVQGTTYSILVDGVKPTTGPAASGAIKLTLSTGSGVANDFNADGKADIFWSNTGTGDRCFWLLNGTGFASFVDLGTVGVDWKIAATADFNGDGWTDILWENTSTGDRYIWLMHGTGVTSAVYLGNVSVDWHMAATGDFNGDGQTDILWENSATGQRGFWLMNGTSYSSWVDVGVISPQLKIVGAADFDGDGQTDIVWENSSTGKRVIWLMNGTTFVSSVNLGVVSTDWHVASVADYDGDGHPDLLWENTTTGDRGFWLMNGTTFSSWIDIGIVGGEWRIAP